MSILKNFVSRTKLLFRSVGYIYKVSPWIAGFRDILFITITFLSMLQIKIGGQLIDAIVPILKWDSFSLQRFFLTDGFRKLAWLAVLFMVIKSANSIRDYYWEKLRRLYFLYSRKEIFEKLESINQQEVEDPAFQKLMSFVPTYGLDTNLDVYNQFSDFTKGALTLILSIIVLFPVVGWSALLLIFIAFLEPLALLIGERKRKNFRFDQIEGVKYVNYLWSQAFRVVNFAELKVDDVMKYFKNHWIENNRTFYSKLVELYKHYFIDGAFFANFGQLLKYIYLVYLLSFSVAQKLSIGTFKAMFDYASKAYQSSFDTWRSLMMALDYLSYSEKFFELIDYPGFGDISVGDKLISKGTPSIKFLNLDFIYPDDVGKEDKKVIENVSLEIKPGEKVAFVGGDGSGKSTVVKTLCGLYEIKSGDYMIGEYSIRELARGELKGRISVMFQDFIRYNMTLRKNIALAADRKTLNKSRYQRAKDDAGVTEFMKTEGLNDHQMLGKLFKGGRDISPGYWQRIAIARMLYRNRDINIMDEPFTYIDGPSKLKIIDGVFEFLGKDKTLIYITRNTDLLERFDAIYYFVNGKVKESGTYKELVKKKGAFYKEMLANQ